MTPTLWAAVLANPRASGTALTVDGEPLRGAPLMFALSTSRVAAERRLTEAARAEWDTDDGPRVGLGPAGEWDDVPLLRTMREHGYLATVTEQPVDLP